MIEKVSVCAPRISQAQFLPREHLRSEHFMACSVYPDFCHESPSRSIRPCRRFGPTVWLEARRVSSGQRCASGLFCQPKFKRRVGASLSRLPYAVMLEGDRCRVNALLGVRMPDQALSNEIGKFLDDYVRYWYAGDWIAVAALYHVPASPCEETGRSIAFSQARNCKSSFRVWARAMTRKAISGRVAITVSRPSPSAHEVCSPR